MPAYFTPEGKRRTYSFAEVEIAENTTIFFNTSHLTPYVQEDRRLQAQELVDYYKNTLKEAPFLI